MMASRVVWMVLALGACAPGNQNSAQAQLGAFFPVWLTTQQVLLRHGIEASRAADTNSGTLQAADCIGGGTLSGTWAATGQIIRMTGSDGVTIVGASGDTSATVAVTFDKCAGIDGQQIDGGPFTVGYREQGTSSASSVTVSATFTFDGGPITIAGASGTKNYTAKGVTVSVNESGPGRASGGNTSYRTTITGHTTVDGTSFDYSGLEFTETCTGGGTQCAVNDGGAGASYW